MFLSQRALEGSASPTPSSTISILRLGSRRSSVIAGVRLVSASEEAPVSLNDGFEARSGTAIWQPATLDWAHSTV